MRFGRRRGEQVQAAVREAIGDFALNAEQRMNGELQRRRQVDLAVIEAVRSLRAEFCDRDIALAQAIENVARAIEQTAVRIESDNAERQALVDAVLALVQPAPDWRREPRSPRVIGGMVGEAQPKDIDLTRPPA